jgi:hypothetical protein
MRRRSGTFYFALALVCVSLACFGLLFFSDSFPTPAQRSVRSGIAGLGGLAVRGWEHLAQAVQDLLASGGDLLLKKAPRVARLLGLREPPPSAPAAPVPPARPPMPPRRVKSAEELLVEEQIDAVFREYFRDFTIGGRKLTIRMPFALNDEREGGRGYTQIFHQYGKGTPDVLWPHIEKILASKAFGTYVSRLGAPGEKAVLFALQKRSYAVTTNPIVLAALRHSSYPGTPTRIFVRRSGELVSEADVYNYLYAVSSVGVDCSGFAYHVMETVARSRGIDLNRVLAAKWRIHPLEVRRRVGLWFFDPASGFTVPVADKVEDLRPLDMILFRGSDGKLKHSALIQSVDIENGIIRYVQSTDWALEEERGVHSSIIRFDPARVRQGLRHYSVKWLQQVRPPFEGEQEPRDWRTDGDRYLWYTEAGGSLVVRSRLMSEAFLKAEPRFYSAVFPDAPRQGGVPTFSWTSIRPSPSRFP